MALFGLFGKKEKTSSLRKGFHELNVSKIQPLTNESVKITFDIPEALKKAYLFRPGQYLDLVININGREEHRSYSICSSMSDGLSIGVKALTNGTVSKWLNTSLKEGDNIVVSEPRGNFLLDEKAENLVLIAAGSGITPILSMAKLAHDQNKKVRLIYGNRMASNIMFREELKTLQNLEITHYLSGETKEGYRSGRINKENFTSLIKEDLGLLKADGFYICGPEAMIMDVRSTLEFFGVRSEKIHFELFTTPTQMESTSKQSVASFEGISHVQIILDGETVSLDLDSNGPTLLEAADKAGMDAPFSCKGGVCCSCRAKVMKGSSRMNVNYALTDEEVSKGYILTCQAHPSSDELIISYDE